MPVVAGLVSVLTRERIVYPDGAVLVLEHPRWSRIVCGFWCWLTRQGTGTADWTSWVADWLFHYRFTAWWEDPVGAEKP